MENCDHHSDDEKFMRLALAAAQQAEILGEVPIGAVVVIEHQVIASGFNCPIKQQDATAHAEILALRKAAQFLHNYRLPEVTLYTTLEPCLMCLGAMTQFRIKRVVYGATSAKYPTISSNEIDLYRHLKVNHQLIIDQGILADECSNILSSFFQKRRTTL